MRLEGQVALVTGGGSGIGEAAAMRLATEGARVAVLGRTREKLERTARAIRDEGGAALVTPADISVPDEMAAVVEQIDQEWGRLDVVFANAGINGVWAPLEELKPDEWRKTIDINLTGTFLTVKYAAPLLKRRGGSVIITSSVNGTRIWSNTGATAYSCSKAGQVAFTKMVALELAEHRIRVNVICPGAVESRIGEHTTKRDIEAESEPVEFPEGHIPLTRGEAGTPEQVADLVCFLASGAANHVTGAVIHIDGAESLLQG